MTFASASTEEFKNCIYYNLPEIMIKISNGVLSLQPPIFMLIFKSTYFYISTVDTSSVDGTYMLTLTIVNNHLKNEQIEPIFNRAV